MALRDRTTTSYITLKDLIKAVGEQTTFKASPTPGKSQYVQWVDYSQPTALLRLSDRLNTEIHEFCSALNTVRTERIDLGLRGIGMCLAISGAERQLIDEVLEQLAHLLCLPVGWLPHDMTHSHEGPAKPRDPEDILFNDSADDENNGGLLYNDDTRKVAYNAATRFGMVNTWFSGEFKQHIIDELGELAIVCLRLPQHADPTLWGGRIDQLVAANHFVVIHQPTGPLLPFLQKRAACCRDWGSVDDSMRKTHWQQIKGQGAAPNVNSLGELAAHAARQHLQKVGLSGDK